jgi:putative ABC transport system permease protein
VGGRDIEWNEPVPEMVVSQAAARAFWPGQSAVGRRIGFQTDTIGQPVVGVVNDTRQTSLAVAAGPVVYVSLRRYVKMFHTMTLVVRGRGESSATVAAIRDAVHELDSGLPLFNVQSLQEIVDQSTAQARMNGVLLAVFAGAALFLAALGVYGLVSYTVMQRRQEMGLRMALGAQSGDVIGLVLREAVALAAVGVAIGVVGAAFATRFVESWLFEVRRGDPLTFAVVSLGLAAIALIASYVPARRAARVDPLLAMRAD